MKYTEYHQDWKDVIRPEILKRDNYSCRVCGIRNKSRVYRKSNGGYHVCDAFTEEWAKANGKRVFTLFLQIAHLDHNKQNNDPSNLLTLCPYHHAINDREHKKALRIMYKAVTKNSSKQVKEKTESDQRTLLLSLKKMVREFTGVSVPFEDLTQLINLIKENI